MSRRVLLTEHGLNRGALAASRSLARAGWSVGVASSGLASVVSASRFVRTHHELPVAVTDPRAFADAVAGLVEAHGYELVFGVDDGQVLALSEHAARVGAVVPHPSHASVRRALDRLELSRAAERAGLAAPRTRLAEPGEVPTGEVVVKARSYLALVADGVFSRVETSAGDRDALGATVAAVQAAGGEAIVQERIRGDLIAVTVLVDRGGRVVGEHQQISPAVWPPEAGVSTRAATVAVDRGLMAGVERLLAELDWFGLAQVQFLVPPGGAPHLIDLNPRFYGSLELAIRAGADFPVAWADLATGAGPGARVVSRPGVRYQWLGGDVRRALAQRQGGLPADLARTGAWALGSAHALWAVRDPEPRVRRMARLLRRR